VHPEAPLFAHPMRPARHGRVECYCRPSPQTRPSLARPDVGGAGAGRVAPHAIPLRRRPTDDQASHALAPSRQVVSPLSAVGCAARQATAPITGGVLPVRPAPLRTHGRGGCRDCGLRGQQGKWVCLARSEPDLHGRGRLAVPRHVGGTPTPVGCGVVNESRGWRG
jgi:hypothetical protein